MKNKLTLKAALELAAPHTWGAAIAPGVLGAALAVFSGVDFDPLAFFSVALVAIFLQSAVNTLNDYADFISGTDTAENCTDETDASIIYNGLEPKTALKFGIALIILAVIFGLYAIITAGWITLIFGAVGVAAIVLYSFVLSAWPTGEAVAGLVMGGVITVGMYHVLGGRQTGLAILCAVPAILTIALIMLTNNTCDIEKDISAKRRTLPVLLGRKGAGVLFAVLTAVAVVMALVIIFTVFSKASFMGAVLVAAVLLPCRSLKQSGLLPENRVAAMGAVIKLNWRVNLIFAAAMGIHLLLL
ncbi:MAG: prenyltransferase [Oscillospiraceae bacterium]|nr:prenyltransferase [Oscillospiraceae bacterium]